MNPGDTLFVEEYFGWVVETGDKVRVIYETDDDEIEHLYDRSQFVGVPAVDTRIKARVVLSVMTPEEIEKYDDRLDAENEMVQSEEEKILKEFDGEL